MEKLKEFISVKKVLLLVIVSIIMYLCTNEPIPSIFVNTWFEKLLLLPKKLITIIESVALSIIASSVFYYFIVYIPEKKQKQSLEKLIEDKIYIIYHQAVGVAWELVAAHQLRGQGIEINMGADFIREWCAKTNPNETKQINVKYSKLNPTVPQQIDIRHHMYDHWVLAKDTAKELSDILTSNIALADHKLLDLLQKFEHTNFDTIFSLADHSEALKISQERIIDLYEKGESLRDYYISVGGVIKE
ncbi:MAG: hypothetical protein N4A74_12070 [Carboxylicivirga sp.]|nr:hypothetical protein [Carboxylicivirga sp.]